MSLSRLTEEALNQQVQHLTKQGKFQTAADIIAEFAYWDIVDRYNEEPTPQDDEVEETSSLPPGLLRDKVIGEFGVNWGSQTMAEENDFNGEA